MGRRRRKKGAGLARLVELAGPLAPPPKKADVIKVEAVPMKAPTSSALAPIPKREINLPIFGNMGVAPPGMKYAVKTKGDEYDDQRGFAYKENADGTWKMQMFWTAQGGKGMPMGFQTLGRMAQLFNFVGNMLVGDVDIHSQTVEDESEPEPPALPAPPEPLHKRVLGYLQGDRECL